MKASMVIVGFLCIASLLLVNVASAEVESDWCAKSPLLKAKAGLGIAIVNETLYAIGGWSPMPTNTTQAYDIVNNSWTLKASMPTARMFFGTAVCQNLIYAIGGKTNQTGTTNATEVYDPSTDTWERKAALPQASFGFRANIVDGKIYVIGGVTQKNMTVTCVNATRVYDPSTDKWTTKTVLPNPVFNYASAVVGNKIYILSGNSGANDTLVNMTQIYDAETNSWSVGSPIPVAVNAAAAVAVDDAEGSKIYVLGGGSDQLRVTYNLTQIYDVQQDAWVTGKAMPTCRFALGACVSNQTIYAVGGADNMTATGNVYVWVAASPIPEFPSAMLLVFSITASLTAGVLLNRKRFRKQTPS